MHLRSNHPRTGRGVRLRSYALAAASAALLSAVVVSSAQAVAVTPPLGTAADFAAVAATTITNTGPTVVDGDIGVSPGTAIVGFPPGTLNGTQYTGNDGPAVSAAADAETAYDMAAGQDCDFTRSDPDLGGDTLPPGVYCFTSTIVGLTGTLTLDAQGNQNAAWIFKTGSTLTTASNSAVVLINGATPCNNNNITWQVGSSATLGSATSFVGNILASASVTLNIGATTTGSLYANTGAVTMDSNSISTCGAAAGGGARPALSTTPSGSVPVGGNISDSATVIGGSAPTGDVTFTLYGPGDDTCTTPIETLANRPLVGATATSGNVVAATPGTYNWVAVYNGDANNAPATSPCGSEKVVVTSQVLTGRAYGLTATATLLGLPLVNVAPTPDTGFVATPESSTTTTPCRATLPGAVSAHVLCANVTTNATTATSYASASVDDTAVGIRRHPRDHPRRGPVDIDDELRRVVGHDDDRLPQGRCDGRDRPAHGHRAEHDGQRRRGEARAQRADPVQHAG